MACFLVSAAEAVVTTVVMKQVQRREDRAPAAAGDEHKIPLSRKLRWLNNMLWGGSALLALEHVWHGEIVPWYPFLTAMATPEGTVQMLREMATVGVAMAVAVTDVWAVAALSADRIASRRRGMLEMEEKP